MKKLKWKQKWNDDKSGYWYAAKVPIIGWEYIVDVYGPLGNDEEYGDEEFTATIFFSKYSDDVTHITPKEYKTKEGAMNACEKHLEKMSNKFKAWLSEN